MRANGFVRGDVDGFFGLFFDNLTNLLIIGSLGALVCGFPAQLLAGRILPGVAVSVVLGNLFYAWQARRLMRRSGREDVTALPYGVNTPTMFAYIFLVMGPVYQQTQDADLAWQTGLLACFLGGVIETAGAFVADYLRRYTPRAALLAALAGIGLTFISMGFVFRIFASPLTALLPAILVLALYASRQRLPWGLPGGLAAVLVGLAVAWLLRILGWPVFQLVPAPYELGLHLPGLVHLDLLAALRRVESWSYLSVIVPLSLFNVLGSLQNLESAEAAGDRYETRSTLVMDGLGTMLAALCGSPFPTTVYIGHPGWKAVGARAGYSALNAAAIALLGLTGAVGLISYVVPLEVLLGVLLWVGITVMGQAFQSAPREHGLATAFGLLPVLAAWVLTLVDTTLRKAGSSLYEAAPLFGSELHVYGIIALRQGFLLSSIVLTASLVFMIERRFLLASGWLAAAAVLSFVGLIHGYELTPEGVRNVLGPAAAPGFAAMYALGAVFLAGLHLLEWQKTGREVE